jgi:gamma-glutamyltranspeptidase/glutathione hydrolase
MGGNAVDAAIATAFALGVVSPSASGIGGGGFAVIYVHKEKRLYAVDFREVGPAAASPANYVLDGKVDPSL